MKNFIYYTPTEVVFGKGSESKVGSLVKQFGGKKVLRGKSAERSGLLDRVCGALDAEGVKYVKLGGMSCGCVITKEDGAEKRSYDDDVNQ